MTMTVIECSKYHQDYARHNQMMGYAKKFSRLILDLNIVLCCTRKRPIGMQNSIGNYASGTILSSACNPEHFSADMSVK